MYLKTVFLFATTQINFLLGVVLVLPDGSIKGQESVTLENKTFYGFEGIPYAAPPIGNLRFQPPQPPEKWDGILDTTSLQIKCHQRNEDTEYESEDCLFLNVYTPELPNGNKNVSLPVMFYIHGGGFVDGTSPKYPDLYINNEVIFVSINYRLNIYGFLSTQDSVIPGNNGLKDQQLALQWVQNHIHLFGGNPNQVTIFGQSAGSASCAYQLLSLKSNGLFHGAILQSGSFLSPWSYQRNARKVAFATAALLNSTFYQNENSEDLLEFLQSVDAHDLDKAVVTFSEMENTPENIENLQGFYYAPVVEEDNKDAFLTEKMFGLLESGNLIKVPIIIGFTSEESLLFYAEPYIFEVLMTVFDKKLEWLVPNDMQITNFMQKLLMGWVIRNVYTQGGTLEENLGDAMRYCSDTSFTRSIIKHAEIYSKFADTYFYQFSFDGAMLGFNVTYDGAEKVPHCGELLYIFCSGESCDDTRYPEEDRIMRKQLMKLWTDFAKFKNPTPEPDKVLQNISWPKVSTEDGNFYYLNINETLEIRNHPKKESYLAWSILYDSLGLIDFDTY